MLASPERARAGGPEAVDNRNYAGVQGVLGLDLGLKAKRRANLAFGMAGMLCDLGLLFGLWILGRWGYGALCSPGTWL